MRLEEQVIIGGLKNVNEKCKMELETLDVKLEVPKAPFPELSFPGLYDILYGMGIKIEHGKDYTREAEEALGKYVKEKYNTDWFFVNKFPFAVKPFYVMKDEEDPQWARSIDLVYKGMEMSSGGQREHRYEKIIAQANEKWLNLDNLKWFTEFFKYGAPPHGGFSMGIERLTMQLLDLKNVRETALFPRSPERLLP
jgi:aspartyl-tRNA synthetase